MPVSIHHLLTAACTLACLASAASGQTVLNENFASEPTSAWTWNASTGFWTSTNSSFVGPSLANGLPNGAWTSTKGPDLTATTNGVTVDPGPALFISSPPSNSYALASYKTGSTPIYGKVNSPYYTVTPGDYYKVTVTYQSSAAYSVANQLAMGYASDITQTPLWGHWTAYNQADVRPGELTADATALAPTASWTTTTYVSRAPINSALGYVRLQAESSDVKIQSVNVTHLATRADAAAWADSVYTTMTASAANGGLHMPTLNVAPYTPANRFTNISRTLTKFQTGQPVNIVMLGDSLMEDTSNSQFEAQIEKYYNNGTRLNIIQAVGSGTGMDVWNDRPAGIAAQKGVSFTNAVVNQHPDLVIVGGISNSTNYSDITAIIDKIHAQLPAADVLLMTGPTYDPTEGASALGSWQATINPTDTTSYRGHLLHIAQDENSAFFDLRGAWGQYTRDANAAGIDLNSLYRDGSIHTSTYGKQILGRSLAAFLEGPIPEPSTLSLLTLAALPLLRRRPR